LNRLCCQLLITLLLVCGLQTRIWADNFGDSANRSHAHLDVDPCHGHDAPKDCDPSHDERCPDKPHHHHGGGCCGVVSPFINACDTTLLLRNGMSQLLPKTHERETIPEGPYLSSDRPPLI